MTGTTRRRRGQVATVLSAVALAAGLIVAPAQAVGDVKGPGCRDITDGNAIWDGPGNDGPPGQVTGSVVLSKAPCKNVTYTFYAAVEDHGVPGTYQSSTTYTVNTDGVLVFSFNVADPDPDPATSPCAILDFYATTSFKGKVIDRAPDTKFAQSYDNIDACGSPSRDFH